MLCTHHINKNKKIFFLIIFFKKKFKNSNATTVTIFQIKIKKKWLDGLLNKFDILKLQIILYKSYQESFRLVLIYKEVI